MSVTEPTVIRDGEVGGVIVSGEDGSVVVYIGPGVAYRALTPVQARELAYQLTRVAREVEAQS